MLLPLAETPVTNSFQKLILKAFSQQQQQIIVNHPQILTFLFVSVNSHTDTFNRLQKYCLGAADVTASREGAADFTP